MVYSRQRNYNSGVWLIVSQKLVNRPDWWKGKFALFWMLARRGIPVQRLSTLTPSQWARTFIDREEGTTCSNSTVSCDSQLDIRHQWSD